MIIASDSTATRGKKDARRHREKQKEVLRKQIPGIIADESIITQSGGKVVKVPIKNLQNPHFQQGRRPPENGKEENSGGRGGFGQGAGKAGDIIGRRPGQGNQPGGKPGSEPGLDYIVTEVDIEEIIELMHEDLGLPNLQEKDIKELEMVAGVEIKEITRGGPWPLLHRRRTAREGMKRYYSFLNHLKQETGRSELECHDALKQADGILADALLILADPDFSASSTQVEPFPIFYPDDLRFLKVEQNIQHESNAVVIAMMDVSGSMDETKKYYVRSILFWIVNLLRKTYDHVAVRFIIHHAIAKLVEEHDFFHTGESGGTRCVTAYELAEKLVETEYPVESWNNYVFHFSDGEDWDPDATAKVALRLIQRGIQMLGYGDVHSKGYSSSSNLLPAFKAHFPVSEINTKDGFRFYSGEKNFPFLGAVIEDKKHIYLALLEFLKKGRWAK